MAAESIPFVIAVQLGGVASASLVRQTPPPAAPRESRQSPGLQLDATPIDVTRPDSIFGPNERDHSTGTLPVDGPSGCHVAPLPFGSPPFTMPLYALRALDTWAGAMYVDGYA